MEEYLRVGTIASTHGLTGEVKVYPTTDDVHRFDDLEVCWLDNGREKVRMTIEHVKYFKQLAILKFKGLDHINDVEAFRGKDLYVDRAHAQPLEENEYYIGDLIGLDVMTDTGTHFGCLRDVMETGANDVYIIDGDDGKEYLFPAIPECILSVDPEGGSITVHLMKGLLDL